MTRNMTQRFFAAVVLLWALFVIAPTAFAQSITLESSVYQANGEATPTLSWSTSPAADSCTATGSWSGEKPGAGTEEQPTITSSATYNLACVWNMDSATLSWTPPTENTDGSAYVDAKGYAIHYGSSSGDYSNVIEIDDPSVTTYIVEGLPAGEWFFVAGAVNQRDVESDPSNEASKVITGTEQQEETVGITVNAMPNPVGNLTVE